MHDTFVDGQPGDVHGRVVEDGVAGSPVAAHTASLPATETLQTGARQTAAQMIALIGRRLPVAP